MVGVVAFRVLMRTILNIKKILKNLTFALNSKSFIKKALINTTTVNISIISIAITIQYVTSL